MLLYKNNDEKYFDTPLRARVNSSMAKPPITKEIDGVLYYEACIANSVLAQMCIESQSFEYILNTRKFLSYDNLEKAFIDYIKCSNLIIANHCNAREDVSHTVHFMNSLIHNKLNKEN